MINFEVHETEASPACEALAVTALFIRGIKNDRLFGHVWHENGNRVAPRMLVDCMARYHTEGVVITGVDIVVFEMSGCKVCGRNGAYHIELNGEIMRDPDGMDLVFLSWPQAEAWLRQYLRTT